MLDIELESEHHRKSRANRSLRRGARGEPLLNLRDLNGMEVEERG